MRPATGAEPPRVQSQPLVMDSTKDETDRGGEYLLEVDLRGDGSESVSVEGHTPIAVQYRVTETDWWTIYGNSTDYKPDQQVVLQPDDTLGWELMIAPRKLVGPTFCVGGNDRVRSGEYRLVYWGFPEADVAIAQHFSIEFDNNR